MPVEGLLVPPDAPPGFEANGSCPAPPPRKVERPRPRPAPTATRVSGELPASVDAKLAAAATCAKGECAIEALLPEGVEPAEGAPVALWSHELAARATITFPRSANVDVYGVVVKGAVKVRGVEAGKAQAAPTWTAFRLPGAGGSITAEVGPASLVVATVSDGEPIREAAAKLHAKGAPRLAWKARPAPVALVDLARAEDLAWAGGSMHARLAFEGAGQRAALGLLLTSADARVSPHVHDASWEVLGVLRPSGAFRRASAPGKDDLAAAPLEGGSVVAIPKGVTHAWDAGGSAGLLAVQLFAPPGPEQRFRKAAAAPAP